MALTQGSFFGSYEIAELIGSGGMGEVWRANDTSLKRDVALKVLPAAFVQDADRLARFQREAEVLAALNHPNIAQVYGLEKSDGQTAIVMELVEGPTLADRIGHGPIPPDEAMNMAFQIIAALEAAHEKQIVHRDLKPANVKVRDDGTIKVLDFGISKPIDPRAISGSPVLTTPAMTQTGVILGTAAYMSPEQARGRFVDVRTDIWAFGCLLFEMLTGQPAFGGEDVMLTLARVLDRDTDLSSIPKTISPAVRHTIRLCLQKDPSRRIADIRDVRLALAGSFESELPQIAAVSVAPRTWRRALLPLGALAAGALVAAVAAWFAFQPPPPQPDRFAQQIPEGQVFRRSGRRLVSITPDGRAFVYNTPSGVFLRAMNELDARLIPGTEEDLDAPFFSPDGQTLAYWAATNQLKRIALTGGASVPIASDVSNIYGASWAHDGTILFGQPDGIYRVAATGGTPQLIIPAGDGGEALYGPQLLPDGDLVLFSAAASSNWDGSRIVVQSIATGERTVLIEGGNDARYVETGHIVYAFEDGLFGRAFDMDSLTVSGSPVSLIQEVARADAGQTGVAHYEIADDGTLVYVRGAANRLRSFFWVDRNGGETRLDIEPAEIAEFRISPGGDRAAVGMRRDTSRDIWVYDLIRGNSTRLTFEQEDEAQPLWSPDGRRIAYRSVSSGIAWSAADGTGQPEVLLNIDDASAARGVWPDGFSEDGELLVYEDVGLGWDLMMLNMADGTSTPLIEFEGDQEFAAVSPDGRWLAYESSESGQDEIIVRPFPDVENGKWQVSRGGGFDPIWSPDSSELFYRTAQDIRVVSIETEPAFSQGIPRALFSTEPYVSSRLTYAISADGERFLMIKDDDSADSGGRPSIVVVQNWFEELKALVPVSD